MILAVKALYSMRYSLSLLPPVNFTRLSEVFWGPEPNHRKTVGTLYYEFGSLLQLRYHVSGRILDIFLAELDAELARLGAGIEHTMLTYVMLSRAHENLWTFLFTFQAGPRQKARDWYNDKIALVFNKIELGLAPYTRSRKQAREAARVIWSSVHGMFVLSLSGKLQMVGVEEPEQMVRQILRTYLIGLQQPAKT
jgi:AcrR family transcriptional regulator